MSRDCRLRHAGCVDIVINNVNCIGPVYTRRDRRSVIIPRRNGRVTSGKNKIFNSETTAVKKKRGGDTVFEIFRILKT